MRNAAFLRAAGCSMTAPARSSSAAVCAQSDAQSDAAPALRMHHRRSPATRVIAALGIVTCATYAACVPRSVHAEPLCDDCELQLGAGHTYHFWGLTGGNVLAATVNFSGNRYELGLFRVATQQTLEDGNTHGARVMAPPYWGISASRRWRLFERGRVQGLFAFGLVAKTSADQLSSTHWAFASQLGLRFRLPGNHALAELSVRHWSNAGIRLPNHGQDFLMLTIKINSGAFGSGQAKQAHSHPNSETADAAQPTAVP
jgi:hypothetical protein